MRKGFLISLVSLAFAAGVTSAQEPPAQFKKDQPPLKQVEPGPAPQVITPLPSGGHAQVPLGGHPSDCCSDCVWTDCCQPQLSNSCWGGIEYLRWWVTDGPIPGPLVTTGNPNDGALAGTLGQPDTRVLFGNTDLDYGQFSGVRLTLGGWWDCDRTNGIEISAFALERQSVSFNASSNNNGFPPIYVPAFNVPKAREDSLIVADPLQRFGGTVDWDSSIRLWGLEVNGLHSSGRSCSGCDVAFLCGFRYLDLEESLRLTNTTNDLDNDVTDSLQDRFDTRNRFYGAQIGARAGLRQCGWSADLTGKLAVGGMQRQVDINGQITESGTDAPTPGTFPGAFFTQPSNIGRQSHCDFTVIPEVELKVGFDVCSCLRAYVGYDVLYLPQVVRPGAQVDRNLDLSQSPIFSNGNGNGTTPAVQPRPQFNETDFWAHGVIFGFELRY